MPVFVVYLHLRMRQQRLAHVLLRIGVLRVVFQRRFEILHRTRVTLVVGVPAAKATRLQVRLVYKRDALT